MQVSVIIPVRGRQELLLRCVQSVLEQTYRSFELIVIDDGSEPAISHLPGTVRLYRIEPSGVSAARNYGVSMAQGEWLAFLDSDDLWTPQKLEKQIAFHRKNTDYRISQTGETWVRRGVRVNKKSHHKLASGECFELCLRQCAISPSSVLLERRLFEEQAGFDERMLVCEDYDLWLRIVCREEVGLIDEELIVKHGGHQDQLSRSQPAIDRFRIYSLLKLLESEVLSNIQAEQALRELHRKLHILILGAKKRESALLEQGKMLVSRLEHGRESIIHDKRLISDLLQDLRPPSG